MLTNPDPNRNIEELNDYEVYEAIRYLEPPSGSSSNKNDYVATPRQNGDDGVVICIGLYIALLGSLAVFWLYLR